MFRHTFGVLAALLVSTSPASAATTAPGPESLTSRIAAAQTTLKQLEKMIHEPEAESAASTTVAQHWHNYRPWDNWNNWRNGHWHNGWHNH